MTGEKTSAGEVNSLADYIRLIKENHLEGHISRGENRRYPSIEAAAFRRNGCLDIEAMVEELRSEIGNGLTELQNKHFLAFSQHYGLPTNLLDFTTSPLISLYFACAGETGEDGCVYFLDKRRLIDVTGDLETLPPGLLTALILSSGDVERLYEEISRVLSLRPEFGMEFLREADGLIGDLPGNERIHSAFTRTLRLMEREEDFSPDVLDGLVREMDRRGRGLRGLEPEMKVRRMGTYAHLFARVMTHVLFLPEDRNRIELPFYFSYRPANIAARIANQSSIFLYQMYGLREIRQRIKPDFVMTVGDKEGILEDLDLLGINEKFIFNDYDHVASYIGKKHLKKSDYTAAKLGELGRLARMIGRGGADEED